MAGSSRHDRVQTAVVFLLLFLVTNVGTAVYWGGTTEGEVYHCTDGGAGYFTPGSWVHDEWVYVEDVESERMDADTLLVGWTIGRLWERWLLMFGATVVLSGFFTYLMRCCGKGK